MSTAPLDAATERRTEECSPKSCAGDRFWSQRHLSPSNKEEKYRPLGRMWPILFIHSVQFVIAYHMYIYLFIYMLLLPKWHVSLLRRYSHMCFSKTKVENYYSSYFYPVTSIASAYWQEIHGLLSCTLAKKKTNKQTNRTISWQTICRFSPLFCVTWAKLKNKNLWRENTYRQKPH